MIEHTLRDWSFARRKFPTGLTIVGVDHETGIKCAVPNIERVVRHIAEGPQRGLIEAFGQGVHLRLLPGAALQLSEKEPENG